MSDEDGTEELDEELDAIEERIAREDAEYLDELANDLIKRGYDLEQLERDNPYNQWMYD